MLSGELIVGGVFIRLFNDNPSYTVRHPKQFATELMEKVLELMQNPNDNLTPITQSFVSLIYNHPSTADQVRIFGTSMVRGPHIFFQVEPSALHS
jgi:hypothetical protein